MTLFIATPCRAFYNPTTGRWLSRDPYGEPGFISWKAAGSITQSLDAPAVEEVEEETSGQNQNAVNLYGFAFNDMVDDYDALGLIVIFVHGTWSSGRGAFPEDFMQYVQKYYNDDHRFVLEWAGGNNDKDRAEAAVTLAMLVSRIEKQKCPEKVHIVAHSHGGNVSLLASHSAGVVFDTLVTLGTPILERYQPSAGVKQWDNVWSPDDWVQTKPIGAKRTSPKAHNIEIKGFGHSELHTIHAWKAAFPDSK